MHRTVMSAGIAALVLWTTGAVAQPVTSFMDVTGKWSGVGSRGGKTDIEILADGKYTIESPLGTSKGVARIDAGILVLPLSNNQGQVKFTRTGDVLEGPYVFGTLTGTTRVTRVGR